MDINVTFFPIVAINDIIDEPLTCITSTADYCVSLQVELVRDINQLLPALLNDLAASSKECCPQINRIMPIVPFKKIATR